MAIQSNLINSSIETILVSSGIKPGTWNEEQVKSLVYVVLPLAHPTTKARTGKNATEVSLHFKGAFMSTRSKAENRGVTHNSSPFIQFMSELPRTEAEAFEPKPGETQIYRLATVEEEVEDGKAIYTVGTKATRWRHKVTESEQSKTLQPGTRIPYNFRLELGVKELKGLIGAVTEYDEQWESCKELIPVKQPQLHLLLSLGADTHLKGAENKEVYNMDGVIAYHVTLKPENILACKWVMPSDALYDKAALLPDMPVNHNDEMEDISEGIVSKPKTVEQVISMKDPFKNVRKLWIKHLNNGTYTLAQLDEFLNTLNGELGYFWANQTPSVRQDNLVRLQGCAPKAEVVAKQVAQAKAEEQLKVAAPSPKKVEEPKVEAKPEVKQEVKPVPTPKAVTTSAFAGMADDDDDFGDLATV